MTLNQDDVLFWPRKAYVGIVHCKSQDKNFRHVEWRHYNFNEINYEDNIKSGIYNAGIAIKLGRCLKPFENRYIFALDFDGWDAVAAWFGNPNMTEEQIWLSVFETAKRTRVEWHQNKGRLHVLYYTNRPISKRRLKIKDAGLEVRYDELLICSPSIHSDGNPWVPLDNTEITTLNNLQFSTIESQIDALSEEYVSDNNKYEYIKWLENIDNWKTIGVGEGRHNALLILGTSYYYRYLGEWHDYTDKQRREKLWERNLLFTEPKSEEEFEAIWMWIVDKHGERRDKQHKEWNEKYTNSNPFGWPDCISYKVGNIHFSGTPDNKLVEVELKKVSKTVTTNGQPQEIETEEMHIKRTFTACKPARVIKQENPLDYLLGESQIFTIQFKGSEPSGNFTLKQKTLSEIIARLKDGEILSERGIDIAIHAQIKGFEQRGLLEHNNDTEYVGFIVDKDGLLKVSNVEIKNQIDKAALIQALDIIEGSKKFYENRLDLFSTCIKWGMIAPLSFVIKFRNRFLKGLHLHGFSNASKSTSGKFILALDGNHTNQQYIRSMNNIDTIARLGEEVCKTTFPKLVDEVTLSLNDRTRETLNNLKIAIEHKIIRSKFTYSRSISVTNKPSLTPLILTGNPPPPNDSAYMRRTIERGFSQAESHEFGSQESKEFEKFQTDNLDKLKALGDFRNWYIVNNQSSILEELGNTDKNFIDIGKHFLKLAYEYVDRQIPDWFDLSLAETQLEVSIIDSKTAVKNAFALLINDAVKTYTGTKAFEDTWNYETKQIDHKLNMQERLAKIVDNNLLPYIKTLKKSGDIIINTGVLEALYKLGVMRDQLPNLKAFGDYLNITYYNSAYGWVVKGTLVEISKSLDVENEE